MKWERSSREEEGKKRSRNKGKQREGEKGPVLGRVEGGGGGQGRRRRE